jgi:nickel/cobalt exporter
MIHLLLDSLLLSMIHALIPNHWLPLISISKSERWTLWETLSATLLTGLAHCLSTMVLGGGFGLVGYQLAKYYALFTQVAAPAVLMTIGLIYLVLHFTRKRHFHPQGKPVEGLQSKTAIILSLSVAMFFSPCLEMQPYYLTAGIHGWAGIALVSAVYLTVTLTGMMVLVYLAYHSMERFKFSFLEHYERALTGSIFILLGLFSFYTH